MKYLLYDVTRTKSYSSKRNIYLNVARTIQNLGSNWTLVLPPWGLYVPRWKEHNEPVNKIKWSDFFKVEILQELIAVIEFDEFIEHVSSELDLVLILNKDRSIDEAGESDGENELRAATNYELIEENCKHIQFYVKENHIFGLFHGYRDYLKGKKMACLNVDNNNRILEDVLTNQLMHTVFVQNIDLIKAKDEHDRTYWLFRRSMQFADTVISRANKFRRKYFDSDDEKDKTFISSDWQLEKLNRQKQSDEPIGGGYIGVHWQLTDRIDDRVHSEDGTYGDDRTSLDQQPEFNIQQVAKQILVGLRSTNTTLAFVAMQRDDPKSWKALNKEFKEQLNIESKSPDKYKLFRYNNKSSKLSPFELELIEQWICAHARLFIGTPNSMYTRLVQEEREILGFKSATTFNLLCTDSSLCLADEQNRIKY